jgi:zinc transport system substrate-binding protein
MRPLASAVVVALAVSVSTGCGSAEGRGAGEDTRMPVTAAFYPLQFAAERVGGDHVQVSTLTKPGTEPHDLELTPKAVAELAGSQVVIHLAGFQPAVDEAVAAQAKDRSFDVGAVEPLIEAPAGGEEDHGKDPHVWLDPVRYAAVVAKLADRLSQVDAAHAAEIKLRADQLRDELQRLDQQFAEGLKTCARREVVTSHAAFGYLAARYNLTQIPITGLDPEAEPSPQRVSEVAALAKAKGVTTIFFETLVSPKLSETVAKEVGVKTAVLDPIEGVEGDDNYVSVMVANLAALREALGCT